MELSFHGLGSLGKDQVWWRRGDDHEEYGFQTSFVWYNHQSSEKDSTNAEACESGS